MTNFLSNVPTFNPYVQQVPVEAVVGVGMEKQRRYDEGVQRIQSAIDKEAGLDIIRDVDRNYLQSKLNELGNNLKTVAAGDFSKYQLVNSVGGMATKVGQDRNVIDAVTSTKVYRKGVGDMDAAIKDGKSSPSNEYIFKSAADKWLNSQDIKEKFTEPYTPYTEVTKPTIDIIKALIPDSSTMDLALEIDDKGKVTVLDAITRKKIAGLSPERIQTALISGLTPAQMKQLEIDGRYAYSNLNADAFTQKVTLDHFTTRQALVDKRKVLENAKSSTTSVPNINELNEKIAQIDRALGRVDKEYKSVKDLADKGNLESAKATLHSINYLNGISNSFSYTEASQTYEHSPFFDAAKWREEFGWKKYVDQAQLDISQYNAETGRMTAVHNIEKDNDDNQWGPLGGPVPKGIVNKITIKDVDAKIKEKATELEGYKRDFLQRQGQDEAWLDQQRETYRTTPKSNTPVILRDYFEKERELKNTIQLTLDLKKEVEKDADLEFGDIYTRIPVTDPNVITSDGITYTPKEIVDFNEKIKKYYKEIVSPGMGGTSRYIWDDEAAQRELDNEELKLYDRYKRIVNAQGFITNLTPDDLIIKAARDRYEILVNIPGQQRVKEKEEYITTQLQERVISNQPTMYTIPVYKADQAEEAKALGQKFLILAQNGKIANSPDFKEKTLADIVQEDSKPVVTFNYRRATLYEPERYIVTISGESGTTSFNMTPDQKRTVFGNRFDPDPSVIAVSRFKERMQNKKSQTTASDGRLNTSVSNAYIDREDFNLVNVFPITGNLVQSSSGYIYQFNIYDPINNIWMENIQYPNVGMTEKQAGDVIRGLSDYEIYNILYPRSANQPSLTQAELDIEIDKIKEKLSKPLK